MVRMCPIYLSESREAEEVSNRMGIRMPCLGTAKMKWNKEFRGSDASEGCSGLQSQCSCSMCCHPQCLLETEAICHGPLAGVKGFTGWWNKQVKGDSHLYCVFSLHLMQMINVMDNSFYRLFLILFVSWNHFVRVTLHAQLLWDWIQSR